MAAGRSIPRRRLLPAGPGGGGASAGSGAGVGLAGCLGLTFLLLMTAPGVTRRLRLARLSWRTSFVVLIPERPD